MLKPQAPLLHVPKLHAVSFSVSLTPIVSETAEPNMLPGTDVVSLAVAVSDVNAFKVFATTTESEALAVSKTFGLNVLPATESVSAAVADSKTETPLITAASGLVLPILKPQDPLLHVPKPHADSFLVSLTPVVSETDEPNTLPNAAVASEPRAVSEREDPNTCAEVAVSEGRAVSETDATNT